MNTYRITVAYDGTAYRGWQRQENTELTVQGILERRISEIAGKKTVVSGSGRTDSGVHALGQECSLYLEQEIDMDSFKKQLNALLVERDALAERAQRRNVQFRQIPPPVEKCFGVAELLRVPDGFLLVIAHAAEAREIGVHR